MAGRRHAPPRARGSPAAPLRSPLSTRLVDGACVFFAVWTLCCHAVVAAGGSLFWLLPAFGLALAALVAVRRRLGSTPGPPSPAAPQRGDPDRERRLRWLSLAGVVVGLTGAVLLAGRPVAFWWLAVATLGVAAAVIAVPEPVRLEAPASGRGLEIGLFALAVGCAVLALCLHRVDYDDAFYVNLAVAIADDPAAPLLAKDTLHGVEGLPIHLPVYRFHSYEVWNGALSAVSGIPAIAAFHLVSAALGAFLVPLALARLWRLLAPDRWLWTTAVTLFVLVAVGEVHRWYGNFALVRIWQGKGLLLSLLLPLIQAYAIEFATRPARGPWLRLAAAQIAAVGCSASALWAGPVTALVAASCALRPDRRGLKRLALVALSAAYVVAAGVLAKQVLESDPTTGRVAQSSSEMDAMLKLKGTLERRHQPGVQLDVALLLVTGEARLRVAALAAMLAAWALCPPGLARRFAIVAPLAVILVLLNPYTTKWVSENLTGASYWRTFWVLPVPLLLALMLSSPLRLGGRVGGAATLCACLAFAWTIPRFSTLSAGNNTRLGLPGLKVEEENYRWATILSERAGPGALVAAPQGVSVWLPTLHDRVYPAMVRPAYLNRYKALVGVTPLRQRVFLTLYVGGESRHPQAQALFAESLEALGIDAVMLEDFPGAARARQVLREQGFELDLKAKDREIWLRS